MEQLKAWATRLGMSEESLSSMISNTQIMAALLICAFVALGVAKGGYGGGGGQVLGSGGGGGGSSGPPVDAATREQERQARLARFEGAGNNGTDAPAKGGAYAAAMAAAMTAPKGD